MVERRHPQRFILRRRQRSQLLLAPQQHATLPATQRESTRACLLRFRLAPEHEISRHERRPGLGPPPPPRPERICVALREDRQRGSEANRPRESEVRREQGSWGAGEPGSPPCGKGNAKRGRGRLRDAESKSNPPPVRCSPASLPPCFPAARLGRD